MSDRGAAALAVALLNGSGLDELYLDGNPIGQPGALALAAALDGELGFGGSPHRPALGPVAIAAALDRRVRAHGGVAWRWGA